MGILDKVKFWKKDDLGLGNLGDLPAPNDFGGQAQQPNFPDSFGEEPDMTNPFAQQRQDVASFAQPQRAAPSAYSSQPQQAGYGRQQDLEVISAKIDALRASLESINQRLANIERIALAEEQESRRQGW